MITQVARSFGRAARRYEAHAALQRQVAARLLAAAQDLGLVAPRRILEVGCGTGLLSRPLPQLWPGAELLLCDLAPAMVATCRAHMPAANTQFVVCDGQALPFLGPFDLILSSMTAQWFRHPAATLAGWQSLLAPGGCLAVALPVAGSLREWERALAMLGLPSGIQPFPAVEALRDTLALSALPVYESAISYAAGLDFARELKGIGGETPRAGYVPLSPYRLRQVARVFEAGGATVTWRIAEIVLKAPEE
jgi:malonyl-CoA O-methyltransferase